MLHVIVYQDSHEEAGPIHRQVLALKENVLGKVLQERMLVFGRLRASGNCWRRISIRSVLSPISIILEQSATSLKSYQE